MRAYELPTSLNINGVAYTIRTDFRAIIDILIAMNDPDLDQQAKTFIMLEWLFLYVRDDPRYSPPQQKSWYTKNVEEYPEIKTMLESEQRFEIVGVLRRMPQNFLFKGLPDDIKDDYKLMDF